LALLLCFCQASNPASPSNPARLTSIATTPGGIIEYGRMEGATTLPAAMGKVLSQIHQVCGEKPTVGQVFRVKGTNSTGVFFTVVDRAQRNRQIAGLVIAAQTGPKQMEAAVVADSADKFAHTANPMMQQLFAAWHPAGSAPASASAAEPASSAAPASTGKGKSAASSVAAPASNVPLHKVTASDNSITLSVPEGWTMDPASGYGAIIVRGPNGEQMGLGMVRPAVDPTNSWQANMARQRYSVVLPNSVVYPFRGDLNKEFVNVFQAWRKAAGAGPAKIEVEKTETMPEPQGSHGVAVTGHMDPDGKGMQFFSDLMIVSDPTRDYGTYAVTLFHTLLPAAVADKEQSLMTAILKTYQPNAQVINEENAALLRQKQQNDQHLLDMSQQAVNRIHQIGQQATARMNATEAANDAQHAGYWAQQDSNARNSAGFSNYLLDQTVVQNNNVGGTGMVGHATVWNSTANALVQADPNKYEIVNTPNYWKGVDY
jgi:hypothetical protein